VERYKSRWAEQLRSLFREAISLKKKLPEFPCQEAEKKITAIEYQMDRLLGIPVNPAHHLSSFAKLAAIWTISSGNSFILVITQTCEPDSMNGKNTLSNSLRFIGVLEFCYSVSFLS
jgi:hypothetical protein